MGGASRADRYRFLVGEAARRALGPGSGSCQTIRLVNFGKVGRIRLSHRRQRTNLSQPSPLPNWLLQRVASILAYPQGEGTSANQTNSSSRPRLCIMRDGSCSLKPAVRLNLGCSMLGSE
jgi:hypothetical protein